MCGVSCGQFWLFTYKTSCNCIGTKAATPYPEWPRGFRSQQPSPDTNKAGFLFTRLPAAPARREGHVLTRSPTEPPLQTNQAGGIKMMLLFFNLKLTTYIAHSPLGRSSSAVSPKTMITATFLTDRNWGPVSSPVLAAGGHGWHRAIGDECARPNVADSNRICRCGRPTRPLKFKKHPSAK